MPFIELEGDRDLPGWFSQLVPAVGLIKAIDLSCVVLLVVDQKWSWERHYEKHHDRAINFAGGDFFH